MSCGSGLPSMQVLALADDVAVVDGDVLALRDQELDRLAAVFRGDLDAALVLVVAAELDPAVHLGDDRAVLRTAGFEELGHPRQTAGDVAGLGAFGGHPGQHFARLDFVAVADREDRAHRQQVTGLAAVGQALVGAVVVEHRHGRTQVRALGGGAPVDDHAVGDAGGFVGFLADRHALDQVLEPHLAADFGDDRGGVGVPFGDALAALDLLAVLDAQARAVGRLVGFAVLAIDLDGRAAVLRLMTIRSPSAVVHRVAAGDLDDAVVAGFEERLLGHLGGAADVEGPHGQLGARLADRLGGDDADRFADVDRRAAGQVAAVAGAADADLGFAGQHRADLHRLHAGGLDRCRHMFSSR